MPSHASASTLDIAPFFLKTNYDFGLERRNNIMQKQRVWEQRNIVKWVNTKSNLTNERYNKGGIKLWKDYKV